MNASRSKRVLFLFSDILTLNLSFFVIAFIKTRFFSFGGTLSDIPLLMLWGNVYLTLPWVVIFLFFGFYRRNWRLSFFSVILAVSSGIFILKLIDVLHDLFKGNLEDIIPTPIGLRMILIYWCLLIIILYVSRFFITAVLDYLESMRHPGHGAAIAGAGAIDKDFGISREFTLAPHPASYMLMKRAMDIIGAFTALCLFLPTLIILAALIKITDPRGPVFFRQYRLGKNGRVFRIFKFRTMAYNAEEVLKKNRALYDEYVLNNFKLPDDRDPRITLVGSFLRKTSLDELPQFFNVLVGSMSLVGPRPIVVDEIVKYDKYRKKLLSVKPGITGWWQVAGRSNIDYPDRIYLEMYYIEKASILFDLRILLETVPTVLFAKGAH
jgi:exopolysaccharide production protein ExoY